MVVNRILLTEDINLQEINLLAMSGPVIGELTRDRFALEDI